MWQVGQVLKRGWFSDPTGERLKSSTIMQPQPNEQDMQDKSEKEIKLAQDKMGNNDGLRTLAICGLLVFLKDKFKPVVTPK